MSRSNDGLPMLPPWLSESDVTQSGYEAPVQNLPHEELIEESLGRRRGRFKNRAPEAERPEAARPEKRRKGWRRDKHDGPSDEQPRQSEPDRAPMPAPVEPVPGQMPSTGYDRIPPEQENTWQAPPPRDNSPQRGLPTRNPSQPSPGFQPLGSRPADASVRNDQPAPPQARRPDLPPPPPLPDPPRQPDGERSAPMPTDEQARPPRGESAPGQDAGTTRPPLAPQNGGWPSTGNPRLDAALSAVLPNHWPAAAPPNNQSAPSSQSASPSNHPFAPPVGTDTTRNTAAAPVAEQREIPPSGPNQTWPTGNQPPTPSSGHTPTAPVDGGHPAVPSSAADHPRSSAAESGERPAADTIGAASTMDAGRTPVADRPADPGPVTSSAEDDPAVAHHVPSARPSAGGIPAPATQAGPSGPTVADSGGPPPWLAAPRPEQNEAPATDPPRRLPPLPDPPAPHERAHVAPTDDEHRPPPRSADGPPPWLGHTAPEQTGQPGRPGLPPVPNEVAAQSGRVPVEHSGQAPRLPADRGPASNPQPADLGAAQPAASVPPPHTEQGAVGPVLPAPDSASATGAPVTPDIAAQPTTFTARPKTAGAANPVPAQPGPVPAQPGPVNLVGPVGPPPAQPGPVPAQPAPVLPQPDPGFTAPSWTSTAGADSASARPVGGGRHRLPAETSASSAAQAPIAPAPDFDQQPVPQHRPGPAYAGDPQPAPHAPIGEHASHPPQFAGGQLPGTAPQAPADQWRNTAEPVAAPESAPVAPYSAPPQYQADQQPHAQPAPHASPQWGTPQGYAQPQAQQPGVPFQPSLDNVPLRRAKKAPGSGWRKAVHHVSGGAINPGMSAEERRLQELVARIRQPVRGDYRIAVLSLKGGVGKTTTTMGIGSIFASIRGDRVIAVDANPDFGTLSQRVPLQTRSTVRDLLLDSSIQRYSDVRRHTSQATSRLEVLASERDPAASEAFSEEEYRAVARILQRFYNIILTDCGTGLMHSAMSGVLDLAHSLVLISSPAIDGARSAAATLDWLSLHGHDHLVRNAVVVINSPRAGSPNVGIQQLREYFLSRCRAVHIIPFDPHMSEGAEIDLHRLHKQTKRAYVELAATVADDFATDHRRYHP
ncbi:nucleotide-binding protein [Nocardia sputi]|uniref:nucleotide-binding protein n=1 Tax=Nocardia sputi TaxID=2943705 RepID=UPI0020BFDEF6|nr:AAA family ATPase [Nocardia sputi]